MKEELAEFCMAAQQLGHHLFGLSWGDDGELMERLRAAPQRVDDVISDGVFMGAYAMLTATTSPYDNVDSTVMGGDCNLLHPEGDILALGDAATPHALLLADEISPSSVIRSRNDLP